MVVEVCGHPPDILQLPRDIRERDSVPQVGVTLTSAWIGLDGLDFAAA